MELEREKFFVTKEEFDALKLSYYYVLVGLKQNKGLTYKRAFLFKRELNKLVGDIKKHNINIDDLIQIGG